MSVSAHRILSVIRDADHALNDPGTGGRIEVSGDLQICELVTLAAESRTLDDPTKAGIRLVIRMKTDGGDCTVTAANGFNVDGDTQAVFANVGDQLELISVSHATGFRWEILVNTGPAALLGGANPASAWLETFGESLDNGFASDFTFSDASKAVVTKTGGVPTEQALTPFFSNNSSTLVIGTDPDGLAMVDGAKIQVATNQIPGYTNVGTWIVEFRSDELVANNIILAGDSSSVNFMYNSTGSVVSAFIGGAVSACDVSVALLNRINRFAIAYDGTGLSLTGNGVDATTNGNVLTTSQTTVRFMHAGGSAFNGRLRKVKWIPRRLSEDEIELATADVSITCHGDSLTGSNGYPTELRDQLNTDGKISYLTQRGMSGSSWNLAGSFSPFLSLIDDAAAQVDPQLSRLIGLKHVLVLFAGTNGFGLGGHSAATEYADFEAYLDARITAGWDPDNIVVATMLPRGAYEAERTSYNASLVSGAAAYGYRLARLDLDARIGYPGAYTDTTYFSDGLHLTYPVGAGVAAEIIRDALPVF